MVASVASSAGSRSASSLVPRMRQEAASSQVDRAGFAKKGVSGSLCGISQKPISAVRRAISP